MTTKRPEYHLRRVDEQGDETPLTVYSLHQLPRDLQLARRDFFGLGTTLAAAVAMMGSADSAEAQESPAAGTPKKAMVVYAHTDSVLSLAFTPDGDYLVSSSRDRLAKIWKLEDCSVVARLEDHDKDVSDIAISPNGKRLVTASQDKSVRFWSLPDGELIGTLAGPEAAINTVSFSFDSTKLAVGAADGRVHLWRVGEPAPLIVPTGHRAVMEVACNPAHEQFVSAGRDGVLRYWSTRDGALQAESTGHVSSVTALAFSGDGKLLAAGGSDKLITLRKLSDRETVQTLKGHDDTVQDVVISADGKLLVSASKDKTVKLWKLPEGTLTENLKGPNEFVSLAISPGGTMLAAGDAKGVITLWDLVSRRLIGFLFDREASAVSGSIFSVKIREHMLSYTLPCGTPIPAGATCTCNCVTGTYKVPVVERKEVPPKVRPRPGDPEEEMLVDDGTLTPLQKRKLALQIKRERRLARQEEFAAAQQAAAMEYFYYMQQFVPTQSSGSTSTCICIPVYR
ncbi:MAG: WD40 repeat domain-containing protein [Pirellulaceae bacterium]